MFMCTLALTYELSGHHLHCHRVEVVQCQSWSTCLERGGREGKESYERNHELTGLVSLEVSVVGDIVEACGSGPSGHHGREGHPLNMHTHNQTTYSS